MQYLPEIYIYTRFYDKYVNCLFFWRADERYNVATTNNDFKHYNELKYDQISLKINTAAKIITDKLYEKYACLRKYKLENYILRIRAKLVIFLLANCVSLSCCSCQKKNSNDFFLIIVFPYNR